MENIIDMDLTKSEQLLKYLEVMLKDKFRIFGPNSLVCEETKDKIFIYVNLTNVLIVHDGFYVEHAAEMLKLEDFRHSFDDYRQILELYNKTYLQKILGLF